MVGASNEEMLLHCLNRDMLKRFWSHIGGSQNGGFQKVFFLGVSEMASAKTVSAIGVRIDDVGLISKS